MVCLKKMKIYIKNFSWYFFTNLCEVGECLDSILILFLRKAKEIRLNVLFYFLGL